MSHRHLTPHVMLVLCALLGATSAQALLSTRLDDVIAANGYGDLDLFAPFDHSRVIDGPTLEQFRQGHGGSLVFAVDVNEAASGTEKASCQGIAIASVELVVTIDGVEHLYSDFSTRTTTLVAATGSTERTPHYTLLGDTGSARITAANDSDINASSFDATLSVPVDIALTRASAARLRVRFLDTNGKLGDPEAFYDYSNGPEDVALVTAEDAAYLDQLAAGSAEAPLVLDGTLAGGDSSGLVYLPAHGSYYVAAYEDRYPERADYDFNDLVVGYRVAMHLDNNGDVVALSGEGYLMARGASYNHDWHLRIDLPEGSVTRGSINLQRRGQTGDISGYPRDVQGVGAVDLLLFEQTRHLWRDPVDDVVNTLAAQGVIAGPRFSFKLDLDVPLPLAMLPGAPFDPYLYVHDSGYEIHLPGYTPVLPYSRNRLDGLDDFSDSAHYPFALVVPDSWQVPVERTDLGDAYPEFITFVQSGRSTHLRWYDKPEAQKVKGTTPEIWRW